MGKRKKIYINCGRRGNKEKKIAAKKKKNKRKELKERK